MNFTQQQVNIDNQLALGYKTTGARERFCLTELFKYMNLKSENYIYEFSPTTTSGAICFDGMLTIRYKESLNIVSYHIVEAKVRQGDWDELILERKKFNNLKSEKQRKDKYFKSQWSDKTIGIIYIQFTDSGSYLFDLLTLYENNLLPKLTKMDMNKRTIESTTNKENKQVYLLHKDLATKYNFKYDETTYLKSQIKEVKQTLNNLTNTIEKKIQSLF